jgi:DNA-binding protein HU-beta
MTKADLIERLAAKADLPRPRAEEILNHVLDDITDGLKRGEKVNISGFGTFTVSNRKARTGRNPKTGDPIDIPATRSAKFRAGKNLRDSLVGAGA